MQPRRDEMNSGTETWLHRHYLNNQRRLLIGGSFLFRQQLNGEHAQGLFDIGLEPLSGRAFKHGPHPDCHPELLDAAQRLLLMMPFIEESCPATGRVGGERAKETEEHHPPDQRGGKSGLAARPHDGQRPGLFKKRLWAAPAVQPSGHRPLQLQDCWGKDGQVGETRPWQLPDLSTPNANTQF